MKLKAKALVAALTMGAAMQANAAINSDGALASFTGTGAGEMFLSVVDRGGSNPQSYTLDLGITSSAFRANPNSFLGTSIAADSNLQSLLSNASTDGGTLAWNLAAADNAATLADYGVLSTSQSPFNISGYTGFTTTNPGMSKLGSYLQSVNGTDTNYAANLSYLWSSSDNAFYDGPNWGAKWFDNNHSTEAGIGQSMGFYFIGLDTADGTGGTSRLDTFSGQWKLAQNGTLTYAAPVPLPPAVWLLGSALVGLVGVGRRRSTAAV